MDARLSLWVLDEDGEPQPAPSVVAWASWYQSADASRLVRKTEVDRYVVSTVFLAIDHGLSPGPAPVLWETAVFDRAGRALDEITARYCTREAAMEGHEATVHVLRTGDYTPFDDDDDEARMARDQPPTWTPPPADLTLIGDINRGYRPPQ